MDYTNNATLGVAGRIKMYFTTYEGNDIEFTVGDFLLIKWFGFAGDRAWDPCHVEAVVGFEENAVVLFGGDYKMNGFTRIWPTVRVDGFTVENAKCRSLPLMTSKGKPTSQVLEAYSSTEYAERFADYVRVA